MTNKYLLLKEDALDLFLQKWQPLTVYTAGSIVLSPGGQPVSANTDFTSGTTYDSSNWTAIGGINSVVISPTEPDDPTAAWLDTSQEVLQQMPVSYAYSNAAQNFTNNTAAAIAFGATVAGGLVWDPATNLYTVPSGGAGRYAIDLCATWTGQNPGVGYRKIYVMMAGSANRKILGSQIVPPSTTNSWPQRVSTPHSVILSDGDTLQAFAIQTSGGDLSILASTAETIFVCRRVA